MRAKDLYRILINEGYSLGDDEDSFKIYEENKEKLNQLAGYLVTNGVKVDQDKIKLEISQDSIYKLIMVLQGYDTRKIGQYIDADSYEGDYVIIDIDKALSRKEDLLEVLKGDEDAV